MNRLPDYPVLFNTGVKPGVNETVSLQTAEAGGIFVPVVQETYLNGQKIGTSHITITNTATVRIDPTLTKSKNR